MNDQEKDDDISLDELAKEREDWLKDVNLRKMMKEVVSEVVCNEMGDKELNPQGTLPYINRLGHDEKRIKLIEDNIAIVSRDTLRLIKKMAKLNEDVAEIDNDLEKVKVDVKLIKERAVIIKEEADKYETKDDKAWERKRDTILRLAVIVISIIAIIISAFTYFKGGV